MFDNSAKLDQVNNNVTGFMLAIADFMQKVIDFLKNVFGIEVEIPSLKGDETKAA